MNRKREKLQAYFAGLFDGEGTLGVYYNNGNWRLSVCIHQIIPLPVGLIYAEYPEGSFKFTDGCYKFYVAGETARRFLEDIKPYAIYKYEQIVVALVFLNYTSRMRADRRRNKIPKNRPYPEAYQRRCLSISETLRGLKGAMGVDSVETWINKSRQYRSELCEAESDVRMIRERIEGVETRHSESIEATSSPEKDIVHSL